MRFLILGSVEAWRSDERLPLGGHRAECLLAMLLLEPNKVVSLPRLIDAAWGEHPPATAVHQVRKIIGDLRRRLSGDTDLIVTDGPGYRLVVSESQSDLGVFEVRLRRAREAAASGQPDNVVIQLQAALDLWRGPALGGIDSPVLRAAAAVLDERRLAVAEELMQARLALGQAREVVAELRALLAAHPLRETTRGQLMLALYRSGRQAEALQLYDEGRRLLAEELGIDPEPQLKRLYERILRNDPDLDPDPGPVRPDPVAPAMMRAELPPPRTLPYDVSDFVGRTVELARILDRVRDAHDSGLTIVAIDGMAGVGKTSLMLHAGHQVAEEFADGQLFVDLHGFTAGRLPMEPGQALDILLRESGVPGERIPDDLRARAALWRVQAAGRRLLVLLDNCADTAQVRPLLPGSPGCLVVITSRSRLTGLDGALSLSLEPPSAEEGMELLTRILGEQRVAGAPDDARALVAACGRLPLAIRIAAARLHNRPQWSIGYLVDRLRDEERRLGELSLDDRSVGAAISLSYDTLGADQQRMFRLLGLRPDTDLDTYAAAALARTSLRRAEALLEDLLDVRLLIQREPGRYTFHDIVRSFARGVAQQTESEQQRAAALHRLLDYYLVAANAAADLVQPGRYHIDLPGPQPPPEVPAFADRSAAMAWFDAECPSLLAAVHAAEAAGLDQHACHLPRSLAYYLQLRGRMQDLQAAMEIAVAASRRLGDRTLEGRSLINLSLPHWHFGRFHDALECAKWALAIAEEVGDGPNEGMCLGRIGMLLNSIGRYEEALSHHERALDSHRRMGLRREQSRALASVSVTQATLGRHAEALAAASRAVAIDRELGDRGSEVISMVNLAVAQVGLGDFEVAEAGLREALELARTVGTPNGEAVALARYADLCVRLGRYDEAQHSGRQALRILWTIRRPAVAAAVQNTLGRLHRARGEYELALTAHRRVRELAEDVGYRIELARALDGIAHALYGTGQVDAAVEHWRLALEHYREMGVPEAEDVRRRLDDLDRPDRPDGMDGSDGSGLDVAADPPAPERTTD